MQQLNTFGTTKSGKLILSNRTILDEWLKSQPDGENLAIRITLQKDFKTYRQLRLLYKLFREISKHTGDTVEDTKLFFKYHFGLCFEHTIEGKVITVCKSISDLNKKEISELIESIDIFANQNLGLQILDLDDKNFLKNEI